MNDSTHKTGSRKTPEQPVSQFGSSETGGRRAVKKSMHNLHKVRSPGKLQAKPVSHQKSSFTP